MPDQALAEALEEVAAHLRGAQRVAFITGAGLSAESGLPTYRGVGGLYNEMTVDEQLPIEDILSGPMFARNPALTWKYLFEIENACRGAAPNAAHGAIAALQDHCEVWVFTQNVDGFHHAAGSRNVVELHGRLLELVCTGCGQRESRQAFADLPPLPRCARCQAVLRPDVVLFGEMLPTEAIARFQRELLRGFDMMFAVGTTAGLPYVHDPFVLARRRGTVTVEINPDRTPLSLAVSHRLACGAAAAMRALGARLGIYPEA